MIADELKLTSSDSRAGQSLMQSRQSAISSARTSWIMNTIDRLFLTDFLFASTPPIITAKWRSERNKSIVSVYLCLRNFCDSFRKEWF